MSAFILLMSAKISKSQRFSWGGGNLPPFGPKCHRHNFWLRMVREGPISISNSKISCFNKFSRFCDIRFPAMRFRHIEITKDYKGKCPINLDNNPIISAKKSLVLLHFFTECVELINIKSQKKTGRRKKNYSWFILKNSEGEVNLPPPMIGF